MENPRERAVFETAIHVQRMEMREAEKPQSALAGLQALWGVAVETYEAVKREAASLWDSSPGGMIAEVSELKQVGGTLWDAFAPGIGEAAIDIRKKAIEEAWFGREVTPKEMEVTHGNDIHGRAQQPSGTVHQSFHDLCRANEPLKPPEPDKPAPGIDR